MEKKRKKKRIKAQFYQKEKRLDKPEMLKQEPKVPRLVTNPVASLILTASARYKVTAH